jgi:hypothetical protein
MRVEMLSPPSCEATAPARPLSRSPPHRARRLSSSIHRYQPLSVATHESIALAALRNFTWILRSFVSAAAIALAGIPGAGPRFAPGNLWICGNRICNPMARRQKHWKRLALSQISPLGGVGTGTIQFPRAFPGILTKRQSSRLPSALTCPCRHGQTRGDAIAAETDIASIRLKALVTSKPKQVVE